LEHFQWLTESESIELNASRKEEISLEGNTFAASEENVAEFKTWWRRINIEHALVFWLTGAFTMLLLSLLAYTTVFGVQGVESSINFVIYEAGAIAGKTFPFLGSFFLIMAGVMLFGTQFSVYGSNSRISGENLVILNSQKYKIKNLPKYFYIFLWIQLLGGIAIFLSGFTEPLTLVVTGAVMNAISMFIYTGMILKLNMTLLAKPLEVGTGPLSQRPRPRLAVGTAALGVGLPADQGRAG